MRKQKSPEHVGGRRFKEVPPFQELAPGKMQLSHVDGTVDVHVIAILTGLGALQQENQQRVGAFRYKHRALRGV